MLPSTSARTLLGLTLLTAALSASIMPMTLRQMMAITDDVIVGKVVARDTLRDDRAMEGAVYTQLLVQGESLRTGEQGRFQLHFLGSHDPADGFQSSEMPALQDTRVGAEAVFFVHPQSELDGIPMIANWSAAYRVERGFGEPVLIGKGEGAAFVKNTKLSDVRQRVLTTHAEIEAAKTAAPLLK